MDLAGIITSQIVHWRAFLSYYTKGGGCWKIVDFILCNTYLCVQCTMYRKYSLENKVPQKGVESEDEMSHKYEGPVP